MNATVKKNLAGGLWLMAVILAGAGLGMLSDYLDCSYLKYVAFLFASFGGGIIGEKYFAARKTKKPTTWWQYVLIGIGLLAFAGLLMWIFE